MSTALCAGAVWWRLIDFNDGEGERKKYIVLLNETLQQGDLFTAALATSKGAKRYVGEGTRPCGCPALACFRIEAGVEKCFPVTTWVQFDNVVRFDVATLTGWVKSGKAGFEQMLAPDRVRSVLNCAVKSRDLVKRDIDKVKNTILGVNHAALTKGLAGQVDPKFADDIHAALDLLK